MTMKIQIKNLLACLCIVGSMGVAHAGAQAKFQAWSQAVQALENDLGNIDAVGAFITADNAVVEAMKSKTLAASARAFSSKTRQPKRDGILQVMKDRYSTDGMSDADYAAAGAFLFKFDPAFKQMVDERDLSSAKVASGAQAVEKLDEMLRRQLAASTLQNAWRQRKIRKLAAANQQLASDLETQVALGSVSKVERDSLQAKIDGMEKALQDAATAQQAAQAKISALQADLTDATAAGAKPNQATEDLIKSMGQMMRRDQEKMQKLEADYAALQAQMAQLGAENTALRGKVPSTAEEIAAVDLARRWAVVQNLPALLGRLHYASWETENPNKSGTDYEQQFRALIAGLEAFSKKIESEQGSPSEKTVKALEIGLETLGRQNFAELFDASRRVQANRTPKAYERWLKGELTTNIVPVTLEWFKAQLNDPNKNTSDTLLERAFAEYRKNTMRGATPNMYVAAVKASAKQNPDAGATGGAGAAGGPAAGATPPPPPPPLIIPPATEGPAAGEMAAAGAAAANAGAGESDDL